MIYNLGRVVPIFKGDYNSATTYTFLDVVYYDNSSFVALDTTTGNLPTDTTHWLPVALKGTTQNPTPAQMQEIISAVETYMEQTDFVQDADYTHIDVIDNHTSTSTTNALAANQGKVLYDLIDDNSHSVSDLTNTVSNLVVDNLTTDDATKALSANQGKVLNEKIVNVQNEVDILDNELLGNKVGFEYGGIDANNGTLVSNTIRMRNFPLYINGSGTKILDIDVPSGFTRTGTYGFLGTTFVRSVSLRNNTFEADGTFDNIRMSYKKGSDETILQTEVDNSNVSLEGSINDVREDVEELNNSIYENIVGFEFGGMYQGGVLVNNSIRMRSLPIKVPYTTTSTTYKLYIVVPDGFVASFAAKYNGTTPVGDLTITDNSFVADGTFDNIRISYKKKGSAGTTVISNDEVSASSATIRTIQTDIRVLQNEVEQLSNFGEDVEQLNKTIYDIKVGFEYGGMSEQGQFVSNTIRMRTLPLYLINEIGANTYILEVPDGFVASTCCAFNGTTFVRSLGVSNNVIIGDGTFDNIRMSLRKGSNEEISQTEVDNSRVYFQGLKSSVELLEDEVSGLMGSGYEGLKYCALGDSITYGYIPRNYTGYPGQLNSYAKLTAQKLGMNFYNYGISGNQLAGGESSMSVRYANMRDDADVITVMGGTNDIRNGVQLGQFSDRTNSTYYGALHVLFQGLYTKYIGGVSPTTGKKVKIIALTPIKLLDRSKSSLANTVENNANILQPNFELWVNAVKEVAAFYSIPVLDFYNLSGINPHLDRTVQGWQDGYTGLYNPYITDGTHPTQEGAEIMSNVLVGFLKGLK